VAVSTVAAAAYPPTVTKLILRTAALAAAAALSSAGCIEDAVLVSTGEGGASTATGTGGTGTGGGGQGAGPTTSSGGGMAGCTDPTKCPGIDTTCQWRVCDGEVCGVDVAVAGVPCTESGGALCDGAGSCVECLGDQHCVNEPCINNLCGATLPDGEACSGGNECQSGHCTDGVCCATACGGLCEACVATKTCGDDGVCAPIVSGTDPDAECSGQTNVCFAGSCLTGKVVFTTSVNYNGNFGGLAGADAICQMHASMGCLQGTYMAWLSTSTATPLTRFTQSTLPYRRVDGALVAQNWNDLIDGQLDVPLNQDELGNPPNVSMSLGSCLTDLVYTGTTPYGAAWLGAENRCADWTSTMSDGTWGRFGVASGNWSQYCSGSGGTTCSRKSPIYCFPQ
jgi:hypothetical protein